MFGGIGDPDENTVVDLDESEKLEDLSGFGGDFTDTIEEVNIISSTLTWVGNRPFNANNKSRP